MPQTPKEALTHFKVALTDSDEDTDSPLEGEDVLLGQIASYTPPPLRNRSPAWPTHGDGEQEIDGGLERLEFSLVSSKYDGNFQGLYLKRITLTCYGALVTAGSPTKRRKDIVTGKVTAVEPGSVETGTNPQMTLMVNATQYMVTEKIGDAAETTPVDIDTDIYKRVIDGDDQLAHVRDALSITS